MAEVKMGVLDKVLGSVPGRRAVGWRCPLTLILSPKGRGDRRRKGLGSRRYTGGRDGRYYSAARLVRALYKTRFLRNEPTEKMRM